MIDWMDTDPAPQAVLQFMSCTCSRACSLTTTKKCPCLENGLQCTELCKLQTCNNQPSDECEEETIYPDHNEDEDDDEDDDDGDD
jgi:hypothetical protein